MTPRHPLTPDDWADALADGSRAEAHLASCPACRAELAELRAVLSETRAAGDVPEPSPYFWDALSVRVRAGVADVPVPTRWWTVYWRPVAAMVGVLGAVALVLASQPPVRRALAPEAAVAYGEPIIVWALIEQVVAPMPLDAVAEAGILPAAETTAAAIEDLTPAEREHLLRLLRAELSGLAQ